MPYDDRSSFAKTGIRIVRIVVPWIGLLIVLLVLWSFVTDYRTAADSTRANGDGRGDPDPRRGARGRAVRAGPERWPQPSGRAVNDCSSREGAFGGSAARVHRGRHRVVPRS